MNRHPNWQNRIDKKVAEIDKLQKELNQLLTRSKVVYSNESKTEKDGFVVGSNFDPYTGVLTIYK